MSAIYVDSIKDKSDTKTLATLSSNTVTLHTDVTVPATTSACEKLYANDVSGVASFSVDGYFDDTKYGFYEMHINEVKVSTSADVNNFLGRVNTSGSAMDGSIYWSASVGMYNNNGTATTMDRADNDGSTYFNTDNTWDIPNTNEQYRRNNYALRFSNPQSTSSYFTCNIHSYGNGHEGSEAYDAWVSTTGVSVVTLSSISGFTFYMQASTSSILSAEILLLGFKK